MAEVKKNRDPLGVPATKGSFQLRGIVSGVDLQRFYSEKNTKSDKPRRTVSFAVQYDNGQRQYVDLAGMEQKSVYFTKSEIDPATKQRKTQSIEVAWRDRMTYKNEGFSMIGTRIGLETVIDQNGNEDNKQVQLTPFDACEYIKNHLKDNMPVYVRGNTSFNTYEGNHFKKFEPSQISLCRTMPDFEAEDFESVNDFTQRIVFMGVAPTEDRKRYVVTGKIIAYNSVEDIELFIEKEKESLAKTMRKVLKPYDAITVFGKIVSVKNEKVVEHTEGEDWGDPNPMDGNKQGKTVTELIIMGADKDTIDTDTYSEEKISEAIRIANSLKNVKKDYGDNDETENDWGSGVNLNTTDEEEDEW